MIGKSDISCHIANNDTDLYDVTEINKLVQGSVGNMSATKKGKLHMKVCQVDGSEWVYIVWPVKYCVKEGANLYSLTCNFLWRKRIKNNHKNNIMVQSSEGNIVLDFHIKTHDVWIARV